MSSISARSCELLTIVPTLKHFSDAKSVEHQKLTQKTVFIKQFSPD